MYPTLTAAAAAAHTDDLVRRASRASAIDAITAAESERRGDHSRFGRLAIWRYFRRGQEAHQQPLRGTRRGASRAGAGSGSVRRAAPCPILLGGDSGVGKSRLIREFEQLLVSRDVLVLRGEAVEQEDGELPYTSLTSALRPLARVGDPAFAELGRGSRAQLAALLPGLDDLETAGGARSLRSGPPV